MYNFGERMTNKMDRKLQKWIMSNHATRVWIKLGQLTTWKEFDKELQDYYYDFCESVYWDKEAMKRKAIMDDISYKIIMDKAKKRVVGINHIEAMRFLKNAVPYRGLLHKQGYTEPIKANYNPTEEEVQDFIICGRLKYDSKEIYDYCIDNNKDYKKVRTNAKIFCIKKTGLTEDEYKLYIHSQNQYYRDNYQDAILILYKILESNDNDEITKCVNTLVQQNLITYNYFENGLLHSFAKNHPYPNSTKIINVLSEKIKKAIEPMKEEEKAIKKEERKNIFQEKRNEKDKSLLDIARKITIDFLNSGLSKKDYCILYNVDIKLFDKYIEVIEKLDRDLYDKYNEYISAIMSENYKKILIKLNSIIKFIKNGVQINKTEQRKFDLIDYYLITSIELDKMKQIAQKSLNSDDYKTFVSFVRKNSSVGLKNTNAIGNYYSTLTKIGDREISLEEKKSLIDYLKKNNIPINTLTISLIQKRYINGLLKIDQPSSVQPSANQHNI